MYYYLERLQAYVFKMHTLFTYYIYRNTFNAKHNINVLHNLLNRISTHVFDTHACILLQGMFWLLCTPKYIYCVSSILYKMK